MGMAILIDLPKNKKNFILIETSECNNNVKIQQNAIVKKEEVEQNKQKY